jgi:hypothetical protein
MTDNQYVRECPPKLGAVINRVNLLPSDLEDFLEQLSEMRKQKTEEDEIFGFYLSYIQKVDLALQEYLLDREGNYWFVGEELLEQLSREQQTLFYLSLYSRQEKMVEKRRRQSRLHLKFKPKSPSEADLHRRLEEASHRVGMININNSLYHTFKVFDRSIIQLSYPQVDENGIVKLILSDLAESFETEKIEVDRIRICSACGDIYWAKKSDAKSCGARKCVERKKYLRKKAKEKTNNEKKEDSRRKWLDKDFSK